MFFCVDLDILDVGENPKKSVQWNIVSTGIHFVCPGCPKSVNIQYLKLDDVRTLMW